MYNCNLKIYKFANLIKKLNSIMNQFKKLNNIVMNFDFFKEHKRQSTVHEHLGGFGDDFSEKQKRPCENAQGLFIFI